MPPVDDSTTSKEHIVDDLQVFARQVFEAQPFTRYIGAELASCGPGHAEITLRIVDHLKQQHGFVHGGVISYLADNAITFAGGLALGGDALTSEYKINYLKPAVGTHLIARAHAKGSGKRQAVCLCDIIAVSDDGTETLCAIAQGTVVAATS
nr:PaaI family thioesterase [Dyella sp. ASV24]